MMLNKYLPPALALISDHELVRAYQEYRTALVEMSGVDGIATWERAALRKALSAVQSEIEARGIANEPWWATERPPVRIGGSYNRARGASLRPRENRS